MSFLKPIPPLIDPQFRVDPTFDLRSAGFLVFQGQSLLLSERVDQALEYHEIPFDLAHDELIYVGAMNSRPYYTISTPMEHPELETVSLRSLLDGSQSFFQLAGRAMQLIQWQRTHRFCGRCGSLTTSGKTELVKICPECELRVYPRLSPCVIMLVHRGDKILLAQRPGGAGFYTVQAGFIEAGESAEQAVAREVMEETGLTLSSLKYFGSQPWPFPGQLMLGYFAENLDGELKPDPEELENAAWFDYRELPEHPGENTISGKLIRHFVAERSQ